MGSIRVLVEQVMRREGGREGEKEDWKQRRKLLDKESGGILILPSSLPLSLPPSLLRRSTWSPSSRE